MPLPDPWITLTLLIALAAFFYLLIPIFGAFYVRRNWRIFRTNLRKSLDYPMAIPHFASINAILGPHRFLGELEAIEGSDLLWIKGKHGSITADMRNATVYNLTDPGRNDQIYSHLYPYPLPKVSLTPMSWNDVFSLTEGTRLFLFGSLSVTEGKYCMGSSRDVPLTVIIFNEDPFTLIPRLVWSGRHSNEFWNFLTPWSILTGSLLLLISTVWLYQNTGNYRTQIISLCMALLPAIIFFPPGVFLYNLYKRLWDKGRRYRAERDLMRLPLPLNTVERDKEASVHHDLGKVLYSRRPSEWKEKSGSVQKCFRIPDGLMEMSEQKQNGNSIAFPDDPEILFRFCQKKAFIYEALSGIVLFCGLGLNYILIWFVMYILF